MRFVTFSDQGNRATVGLLEADRVLSLATVHTMQDVIRQNGVTSPSGAPPRQLADVRLHAPIMPGKILAIGRNYAAHAAELDNEVPSEPLVFPKLSSSVIGPDEPIVWNPADTQQIDWEGELAVVIGQRVKNIPESLADDAIFGYTIGNDISARDWQAHDSQWTRAKGSDTFCPLGPVIVTRDEIPDPHALRVVTRVNDELMQDGETGLMIYRVPFLVAYLSRFFTLEPGDIILTGTPAGVGKARKPPRFLQQDEVVSVTIEPIGTLSNPCQPLAE